MLPIATFLAPSFWMDFPYKSHSYSIGLLQLFEYSD